MRRRPGAGERWKAPREAGVDRQPLADATGQQQHRGHRRHSGEVATEYGSQSEGQGDHGHPAGRHPQAQR
jgi:hypothetical protein